MTNPHIGSSFDEFLNEDGISEEVAAAAVKRVLAWQLEQARLARGLSKSELARQMQLDTLQRAAKVLGRKLVIDLV